MARTPITSPFKAMEDEAYHAFREWPIFLLLRQKELETHLSPSGTPRDAAGVARTDQRPETGQMKGKQA
jgi:hypothetical protein